jgi:hypothetical protein
MVTGGSSLRDIAEAHPATYIRLHRGIGALRNVLGASRNAPPEVLVYWGLTGTGKSRRAREETVDPYVWGPEMGQWFDGYDQHTHCIFEEFRGQLPFGFLLRLLDRYDCRVQLKGGNCQFIASKIIITSPLHPRDWYQLTTDADRLDQLTRRITTITELVTVGSGL